MSKLAVLQFDAVGRFIKKWESLHSVQAALHTSSKTIKKCCLGEIPMAVNCIWVFDGCESLVPDRIFQIKRFTADLDGEEWRDVVGFEGMFMVSNFGRVKSLDRYVTLNPKKSGSIQFRKGKIYSPSFSTDGYLQVTLANGNIKRTAKVHRLVAMAFIPNPDNLPQVNHIDENKTNNRIDNLEWCTAKYNNNYGTRIERARESFHQEPILQFTKNGELIARYSSITDAAKAMGMDYSRIMWVCKGRFSCTSNGFVWRYENQDLAEKAKIALEEKKMRVYQTTTALRRVAKYDLDGNFIKSYRSIKDACADNGLSRNKITHACRGEQKTAGGFIWKYINQ